MAAAADPSGRDNQRHRTRKDLLRAAARLLESGRTPTMDEVATEAMVSRATAYRYFATVEALLVEAPLDGEVPEPQALFAGDSSVDPVERLDRAESSLHQSMYRNEWQLRIMLAHLLQAAVAADSGGAKRGTADPGAATRPVTPPIRQNRRGALIEAALAPARSRFDDASYDKLTAALALVFGTESMVVFRDVLPLTPERAREVKSWMIRSLVATALADAAPAPKATASKSTPSKTRGAKKTAKARRR